MGESSHTTPPSRTDSETSNSGGERRSRSADEGAQRPKISPRSWTEALGRIESSLVGQRRAPGRESRIGRDRRREVYYRINLSSSRECGGLVIDLFQRQERQSGDMGLMKPLSISPDRAKEVAAADDGHGPLLELLAALGADDLVRQGWSDGGSSVKRALVPPVLYEHLLPALAATGRLGWWRGTETRPDPERRLEWDPAPHWRLALVLDRIGDDDSVVLGGELVRDGDRVPIEEPRLLLASGVVLFDERIARLDAGEVFPWIVHLRKHGRIEVPEEVLPELSERISQMPGADALELPAPLERNVREVAPRPVLVVSGQLDPGRPSYLSGRLLFDYADQRIEYGSAQGALIDDEGGVIPRDEVAEDEAWRRLLDAKTQSRQPGEVSIGDRRLPRLVEELGRLGWRVEAATGAPIRQRPEVSLSVSAREEVDGDPAEEASFDLEGEVDFDGARTTVDDILESARRHRRFVPLDDGSIGLLPEELSERFGDLAALGVEREGETRFRPSQTMLLDSMLAEMPTSRGVAVDERFAELRDRLRTFEGVEAVGEPRGFRGTLRQYQRLGLGWLLFLAEFGLGGCLADDMGLGKTIQVLALLQRQRARPVSRERKRPSLVVAPRSLVYNWIDEAERFTPRLRVLDYTGPDREELRDRFEGHDMVVTTYGTLRRDIAELGAIEFDYAILDEAQAIKNRETQTAKAARMLDARHRLTLTGTPIENRLDDLWSLFEFLNPGMLGRLPGTKGLDSGRDLPPEQLETIARGVRPFILRRTKDAVLPELPPKTEQTIFCTLSSEQRRFYDRLREDYRSRLSRRIDEQGFGRSKIHVLEALLRLRQAACHPSLVDPEREEVASAKLDTLVDQLTEVLDEGHKALVFSQFTSFLALVRERLDATGIDYEYLDGSTRDRKSRVERFQSDEGPPVFLISLRAGGFGLNLTAAEYVFLLDPWWNPAVERQAIDRTHRIGQTAPVFAYRLIARDTVEERIVTMQEEKRELAETVVRAGGGFLEELTAEELYELLG